MSTVFNSDMIVPFIIVLITGYAVLKKTDIFSAFTEGAKEGLRSAVSILPSLCFLMTAIGMLRQTNPEELSDKECRELLEDVLRLLRE